jgi:hypothetical protein
MFAVSVLVFFLLKIPTVIGDLTGSNARRAIENIRNQNESTGEKTYRSSAVNRERGKVTDKISPSGRLMEKTSGSLHGAMGTAKISTQDIPGRPVPSSTTVLDPSETAGTTVLGGGNETTLLETAAASETTVLGGGNETTVLGGAPFTSETTVLGGGDAVPAETTVLGSSETVLLAQTPVPAAEKPDALFVVEYEITYIHTDEVIALG